MNECLYFRLLYQCLKAWDSKPHIPAEPRIRWTPRVWSFAAICSNWEPPMNNHPNGTFRERPLCPMLISPEWTRYQFFRSHTSRGSCPNNETSLSIEASIMMRLSLCPL